MWYTGHFAELYASFTNAQYIKLQIVIQAPADATVKIA